MRQIDNMTPSEIDTLKLKGMIGKTSTIHENKRLMEFIQDAAAFIRAGGADKTWNDKIILTTLIHDITGLANNEPCFSPRVTGYAQREQEKL